MEIKAKSYYLRISPRKLRLVADSIRNTPPLEALKKLALINKHGTEYLIDVLKQEVGSRR